MGKGLDCTANVSNHLHALKEAGYTFFGRYYSHSPWKNLTRPEAEAISKAGLYVVAVFEAAGDHIGAFSASQGYQDANTAIAQAKECGQPLSSCIYLAVDLDANTDELVNAIEPYFQAAHAVIKGAGYEVGVYGSGMVCNFVISSGYASKSWLANAKSWSGYDNWHGHADIVQGLPTTVAGISCDTDTSNGSAGGWQVA